MRSARFLRLLLALCPSAAATAGCLHYDVPNVTMQGQIVRSASSFDKGSSTEHPWYLVTTHSFCVAGGSGNLPIQSADRFEIWPPDGVNLDSYVGHTVKIAGHFLPTYIPHFHSYPIFAVTSVEATGAPGL